MLEDLQPIERVFPCAVRSLYESLDSKDQAIFLNAMNSVDVWSNNGLERALRARGLKISERAIRKHRGRQCSCPIGWPNA